MTGRPTKYSEAGEKFLAKHPGATAEQVSRASGLTVSGVSKSKWWKDRPAAVHHQKKEKAK